MWEIALIVAGYAFLLFGFRAAGGLWAAGDAISTWGRRSSERRRAAVERRLRQHA